MRGGRGHNQEAWNFRELYGPRVGAPRAAIALRGGAGASISRLQTLRVLSPCMVSMVVWVRYGAAGDIDVDLCDERGNVCVQLQGLSLSTSVDVASATNAPREARVSLIATPIWQVSELDAPLDAETRRYAEHHIILCGATNVHAVRLPSTIPDSHCLSLEIDQENVACRYSEYAVAC